MQKRAYTEMEVAQYIAMSRSFLRQDRINGIAKIEHQSQATLNLAEIYAI